jgi:hypothetical protein
MAADSKTINWHQNQPAPSQAIRMIHANFPQVTNLGIYVCRNVAGTSAKSAHAEGRALDIGVNAHNPAEKAVGDGLFAALIRAAAQSGIDNVIWNKQIWSQAKGGPRPWGGTYANGAPKNPHTDHIHVEWTQPGSQLQRLQFLELQISILRGGFEDLARSLNTTA